MRVNPSKSRISNFFNLKEPPMNQRNTLSAVIFLLATCSAQAQDVGQHPAVFSPRHLPGVDPSTFVVGHPASPVSRAGHANHEHPAVTTKRAWLQDQMDANTFIVQPPAPVTWVESRTEAVAGSPMIALI
jgi:hypothetical protein